jgi:hypothetical protein
MAFSAIESRYQFNLLLWYGVGALALLLAGIMLAANQYLLALMLAWVGWLVTLPYHAKLSVVLATTTFSAAFIVPFVPGRPFVWEVAALLGWSGVVVLIMLRRFPEDFRETLRRNRWIFLGIIVYSLTLLFIMHQRGFGLRVLGSGTAMGGRAYLQQLICAIFPLLFALVRLEEKTLVRLLLIQWLLSTTYFVSDFAYTFGGRSEYLLYFFELPGDAINFEGQAYHFGIRRFQSFQNAGLGLMFFLLARYRLRDFFGRPGWWLLPTFLGVFGASLLSGHRTIVFYITGTVLMLALAQRFFTARTLILAPLAATLTLLLVYTQADHLPLAAQRALSFLPGIQVDPAAAADAAKTMEGRKWLRHAGWQLIPQYLWVGRGFTRYADIHLVPLDPDGVTAHVQQGVFYNGFIGLMINTGLPGTVGMGLVILGGTLLALRVLRLVRTLGSDLILCRVASILGGFWVVSVLFFLFLHGDAELALKSFALQLGTLIMSERLLRQRVLAAEQQLAESRTPAPALAVPAPAAA